MLNLVLEVKRITKQQTVLKFSEVIKIAQLHGVLHEIMTEKKKKNNQCAMTCRFQLNLPKPTYFWWRRSSGSAEQSYGFSPICSGIK